MLRKILDYHLAKSEKGKPLHRLRPLINAGDTFFYKAPNLSKKGPHIRDAVDVKRWMILAVISLLPCLFMGIWNSGLQSMVYSGGDFKLMDEFLASSASLKSYLSFVQKDNRWLEIIKEGLGIVLPLILVSYTAGGICEALFAIFRGHEISEGFLMTGILFVLVMPPTIPLWMAAAGISIGIILSKEIFGGSGHNIVNPALACRAFLFFAYPGRMTGNVWAGSNPKIVRESLIKMNKEAGKSAIDGYTQASKLADYNIPFEIKKIHIDALASNNLGRTVRSSDAIAEHLEKWNLANRQKEAFGHLSPEQMHNFVTSPLADGGLGLSPEYYDGAYRFSILNYGFGDAGDWNLFMGNKLGCIGETSVLACILGALFLIYTGIAAWRTMAGMALGAFFTALLFRIGSNFFGTDSGAWHPAIYGFPAYKHFLLGGLAFGLVFMVTDPVTSPAIPGAKYVYGAFCGILTIVIRNINPAYPEGVMLAILIGNVFAPLIDHYALKIWRKRRLASVGAATA